MDDQRQLRRQDLEGVCMCSHYEAPAPQRVAETFGVELFEQGKLDLYPGYSGPFIRGVEHVATNRRRRWRCCKVRLG